MSAEPRGPPGTVILSSAQTGSVVFQPQPTEDPDDPLNWSAFRKYVNFGLVLCYVLFTFTLLQVGVVAYPQLVEDIGFTFQRSTIATAINLAGLAIGCVIFIPFSYRYGRRPIYIISLVIQLASAIWASRVNDTGGYIGSSFFMGLGGAISETIVQITIVDLFFIHQYATTNGVFLFTQGAGAYLGPVAAGYVVQSQGWRWMWLWCAIFIGATLVLVLCFFEESTYVATMYGVAPDSLPSQGGEELSEERPEDQITLGKSTSKGTVLLKTVSRPFQGCRGASVKPLRKRLALITRSDGPIKHHFLAPFIILFNFPAVAYTSLTFGTLLSCLAVMVTIASTQMIYPPYNFEPSEIGLMNVSPFVGQLVSGLFLAPLSDKLIVRMARRNEGIYEPEMRLWLALPGGVIATIGIFVFGIGIAHLAHWGVLTAGMFVFACGFTLCLDIALAYLQDCYPNIIGDALVAVVFVRNALAVVISFALSPWLDGMGMQNMFILLGILSFAVLMSPIALIRWGKKARFATIKKYEYHSLRQPSHRST